MPPHILVLDDAPLAQQTLRRCLERAGLKVSTASENKDAYRMLAAHADPHPSPFCAVLQDLVRVRGSGLAFLQKLQGLPRSQRAHGLAMCRMPVVVHSGNFNRYKTAVMKHRNVVAGLSKPALLADVYKAVGRALERHRDQHAQLRNPNPVLLVELQCAIQNLKR